MRVLLAISISLSISFLLASCSLMPDWVGGESEVKLPGERISVLPSKSDLVADETLNGVDVALPPAAINTVWLGENFGRIYNLALASNIEEKESFDIGNEPSDKTQRILSTPIVVKDLFYALDGEGVITAREIANLDKELWQADLKAETFKEGYWGFAEGVKKQKFIGGRIAYGNNMIFATTLAGEVAAFDARRGYEVWRRSFNLPIKSAPVVDGNSLYFITINNKTYSVDASDGKTLWTHSGISETTGILGSPAPVVYETAILVPYSSGEIYVIRKQDGSVIWGDSLAALNVRNASYFSLNDIDATPLLHKDVVYAVGHEGVLTATEIKTSRRIWEKEISSLKTPALAGDFLFLLTTNDELVCIHVPDGKIKWVASLPSFADEENKRDKISWNGPVIAGDMLYITNSIGEMRVISPQDGETKRIIEIEEKVFLPPIVSDRKMYILSNEANLTIFE